MVHGTTHKNFPTLLEHALNQKSPKVTTTDRTGRTVTLEKETLQAQGKLKEIQEKFRAWLWEDAERATRLTNFYNRNYNNWRLRDYDGEAEGLTFPGYSITEPQLRGHQKAGVWRIMHGNTLLAHCVGAGKTWTMQAAAMKMKQLGIANKSLFVVPNNVVAQFEKEFYQIYPNAKLLVLDSKTLPAVSPARTKEMTEKEYNEKKQQQYAKRMRALTSIATEDWDGIIISHDLFKRIPLSQENTKAFMQEQIDALEKALIDARMNAGKGANSRFIKDLEKSKSNLEARLEKLINEGAKDIGIPFEQLGIDQIFVDEADLFKNLYFFTSMQGISGLSNNGSQRSTDLYMKTRYLSERYGGRGICFATATPVSNTMAELYTMMRYLDRKGLEEKGLGSFDAWAAAFARHEETVQLSPDKSGTGFKTVEAFTSFVNMPELITMFRKFADVRTREDLPELEVPKLRGGKAITVDIEPSAALSKYIRETIAKRADAIHNRSVNPKDDNMLKLTNDLRKASLDMRLVDPSLTAATEGGKIAAVADRVYDEYKNSRDVNGAQLIFCDMSIPKENHPSGKAGVGEETEGAAADEFAAEGADNVSVYVEIKEELVRRGIPADRIAFVHDAKNKKQKDALFTRVRNGEIAVIIGSTSKMGAGTNFQDHLVALHHVDAPWRPRDIEQREGRIIRQGNLNREVAIYNYVTRDSYDANMWEKLKNKAFMISQAMSGDLSARTLEDIGANVISFAEVQALASGDPLMAEKVKVDMDYRRLAAMKAGYDNSRYDMKDSILRLERAVTHWQEEKKKAEADRANAVDTSGDNFSITIMDKTYTDRAKADEELNKLADEWQRKLFGHERGAQVVIGKIGNRTILARNDGGVHLGFYVVGENEYPAKWSCASIEYQAAKAPGQVIANNIASIASAKKQMEAMRNELKKGFARQDELDRVTQRRKEIEDELERRAGKKEQGNKTKEAARGESEGGLNNAEKAGTKYSIIAASSGVNGYTESERLTLEKEKSAIRKQYEGTDKWLKAPNGESSHLNADQWLTVRTPTFKKRFGDWTFVAESSLPKFSGSFAEARKLVADKIYRKSIINKESGLTFSFSKAGKKKIVSDVAMNNSVANGFTKAEHLTVAINADKLLSQATLAAEKADDNGMLAGIKYFAAYFRINNKDGIASFMIKETNENGMRVYTAELLEIKKLGRNLPNAVRKQLRHSMHSASAPSFIDLNISQIANKVNEVGINTDENGEPIIATQTATNNVKYSASSTGENINRIVQRTEAELEKEADDVLGKYAVNREKLENGDILYTMPGGVKLQFSIRDRLIIKNPQNLKEEKSKHGIAEDTAAEDVIVPGCFNIVDERGKVGHISLATLGVNGSAYHEIFHAVWDMLPLTQKERDAINAKARERIAKQAEGKKESVDEARAELAREWFLTRNERRGTFAGRIGQMIHDLITRLTHWYRGVEDYNDVMRRVESGEVWKRAAEDEAYAGATPLQMFTDRLAYMTIGAKGKGRSKAEKAERDRARKLAEKMEKQGLAPEAIYYATGWFKLADGKWHYEIASNFEGIDLMPLLAKGDGGRITVSDIYDNEQLYAEYPELADVEVRVEAMTDSADESKADTDTIAYASGNTVVFNANALNAKNISDPDTKTTVIHELEHIIQHKEGFGLGGSDVGIREDLQQTVKDYRREAKKLLGSAGRLYGKYRRAAAALNEARNRLYELTVLDPQELRKQESKVEAATIALEKAKEELLKRVSASALGRANRLNELADGLESTVGQIEKKVEKELREEARAELGKDAAEADIRRWVGERLPEAVSFALYQNLTGEQISRMDEARAIRYYGRSEEAIRSLENRAAAARAQIESLVRGRNTARLFHNLMDAADMHIGATMGGSDTDIERTGAALDKALDRLDATDAERNMIESALDAYSLVKEQAAFMKDMPTLEDAELALNIYRNLDDAATSAKKSGKDSAAESDGADGIDYSARLSIGFTPGTDVKYSLVAATTNLAKKIAGKGKEQNARIRVADTKNSNRMTLRNVLNSPHKLAKKFPVFKPFFEMGAVAMRRQEQLRSKYGRTMARIDNMLTGNVKDGIMNSAKRKLVRYGEAYRENKAAWHALMLEGDAAEKEFTRGELEERSIAEPVIRAYLTTRQAVRNIYEQVNRARKKVRRHQTTMTRGELDNFMAKTAPFAENLKVTRKETGDFLVTYDAPQVWSSEETVSAETLADMRANAVHDETVKDADGTTTKVKRGNYLITNVEEIQDADGNVKYRVEYSMSVPDVHQLKGYIPHFFHDYLVTYRNADGVRVTVGSGRTVSEAREAAEKYLGSNKEAGEDGILIVPKTFDFGGETEGMRRIIIGDTEMEAITRNIAEQMGFTLADARRQARQMGLGRSSKERYFGNLHHRNGAKGWESEDLDWALSHYFNAASRYIALGEFKNAAVSMFERRFGRFDARYTDTLANFVQNYIKDVNGDPTYLEKLVTDEIMRSEFWRKYIVSNFGERAALHFAGKITGFMSIMKLGFFNSSSALLNLSQLVNTMGLLGDPLLVGKAMARALHPGVKERKLYEATGLLYDIGLDASGGGYGKFRAGKALYSGLEKTMYLFGKMDALARQATVIAAYEQAIKEGKGKKNAIAFAEEINRKANFDYSVADAPDLFRRTGVIGQVMFQFMKYPIKEMELIAELADDLRQNRPGAIRRNVSFWTPFFLMSGIFGFPAADWFDEMFKTLFDFGLINKIKRRLIEWSAGDPEKTMVANLAMYGMGSLAGINVSRRAGLGDLNPSSVPDSISEFFGPTGSTIANAFKGLGQFAQTGDIMPTVRALSPQLANYYNAVVGYGTGKRGRQTTRYEEMYDRLVKGMGFQTVTEARENDVKKIINEQKTRRKSGRETAIDAVLSKQERGERLTRDDIGRLREYGVSSRDLAAERRKKRMTNIERTRSNLTKKEQREFGALTGALEK